MSTQIQKFDELISQVTTFVSPAKTIKVTDNSTANDAVETGKKIKDYQKKIEALRKDLVDPLNAQVKAINDYAKQISAPLDEVETHLKKQLSVFAEAEEKKRQEELRKIEEARKIEQAKMEAEANAALERLKAEAKESGEEVSELAALVIGAQKEAEFREANRELKAQEKEIEATALKGARKNWKAEIVNEAKIPREFLSVDMKKINAAIKAGAREIPGVRIFQETSVSFGKTTAVPVAALVDEYCG